MVDVPEEGENNMFQSNADQQKLSAFNMAQLDLYRLHVLLSDCNTLSRTGELVSWKRTLDALYRELCPHFISNETSGCNELIKKEVLPHLKIYVQLMSVRRCPPAKRQQSMDNVYTYLSEYEITLRKIMKRLGIHLPSKGLRSALGGGD